MGRLTMFARRVAGGSVDPITAILHNGNQTNRPEIRRHVLCQLETQFVGGNIAV